MIVRFALAALVVTVVGCKKLGDDEEPFGLTARVANETLSLPTTDTDEPPGKLSETGVFADLNSLTLAPGFVPYDVNLPFWSDGAIKSRWVYVPAGETVANEGDAFTFPVGSVFVKHFAIALDEREPQTHRPIETRLFVKTTDDFTALVYKWTENQTDAELIRDGAKEDFTITLADGSTKSLTWEIPTGEDCHYCHGEAPTKMLGFTERQLNRDRLYGQTLDHQLRAMSHIGFFKKTYTGGDAAPRHPTMNGNATLSEKARAYLAVNCASCHKDETADSLFLDFSLESDLSSAIGVPPDLDNLDITDSQIIYAGNKEKSAVWLRMKSTTGLHMPFISSKQVDEAGAELIGRWIDEGAQ